MQLHPKNLVRSEKTRLLIVGFLLFLGISSNAQQLSIQGTVLDSSTHTALADVYIYTKKVGTFSNSEGRFSLVVQLSDTVFFSRIGYTPISITATSEKSFFEIALVENNTRLDSVTIYGNINLSIPTLPKSKAIEGIYKTEPSRVLTESRFVPKHSGVGGFMRVNWNYFSKEEKSHRKLIRYKKYEQSTEVYRNVITSELLKEEFCNLFKITEADFYKKLESFTKDFPEAAFLQTEAEIKKLLVQAFATKEK